jgi:hypothetical protein
MKWIVTDFWYRGFEPRMNRREASLILELPYVPRLEHPHHSPSDLETNTDVLIGNVP